MGWEPNPIHTPVLRALELSYNQCGYRTIIHTQTGVGVSNSRNKVTNNQEILYGRNNCVLQYAALEDWPNQIAGFLQDDIDDQVNLVIIRKL